MNETHTIHTAHDTDGRYIMDVEGPLETYDWLTADGERCEIRESAGRMWSQESSTGWLDYTHEVIDPTGEVVAYITTAA